MKSYPILTVPDARLRTVASPVDEVNDEVRACLDRMLHTMYEAPGIGLAATQVNVHKRMIVIDLSETRDQPLYLINPELVSLSDETEVSEEGCLSVPEIYAEVPRSTAITVNALDYHGKPQTIEAEGLLAVCIQHEIDHLQGKVFIDYLSPLKRNRVLSKLKKLAKNQASN